MRIHKKMDPSCSSALPLGVMAALIFLLSAGASPICIQSLHAQQKIEWTTQQEAMVKRIQTLRHLSDKERGRVTKQLALAIRQLPPSENKVRLATGLATLSTEGDPGGRETVQEVATTLTDALREHPLAASQGRPAMPYALLAAMVHFEHMDVTLDSPEFASAINELKQQDLQRQQADFTLADLEGHEWTLKNLHGKVVLVNFWATWCPPCRKEIPDLEALSKRFKGQGLVVLGISDDDTIKVKAFARREKINYPILLDPEHQVNKLYSVAGIPMSFVYDRDGKLVAESMDMRTRGQFLAMLAEAGLK
ncbi:MAG TPA: TlpA disulfide reductase family protein [Terriglobia bacterium]|nr:TlpA disulfide reductase family protein [Terriglobia bacterium]